MSSYQIGDRVRILAGWFKGFVGTIDDRRRNQEMAIWGFGEELLIKLDGRWSRYIFYPDEIEIVTP